MRENLKTTGEHSRICPKCENKHLSDNNFCDHCLFEFDSDFELFESRFGGRFGF